LKQDPLTAGDCLRQGEAFRRQRLVWEAAAWFAQGLLLEPRHHASLVALGRSLWELGRPEESLELYEAATAHFLDDVEAGDRYAGMLAELISGLSQPGSPIQPENSVSVGAGTPRAVSEASVVGPVGARRTRKRHASAAQRAGVAGGSAFAAVVGVFLLFGSLFGWAIGLLTAAVTASAGGVVGSRVAEDGASPDRTSGLGLAVTWGLVLGVAAALLLFVLAPFAAG
jgi:tetratricopeptide (TPR) repeat protein